MIYPNHGPLLRRWTGLNGSSSTIANFVINGNIVSDKTVIAVEFNNFFVKIGSELASKISSTVNPLLYVNNVLCSIVIPNVSDSMKF